MVKESMAVEIVETATPALEPVFPDEVTAVSAAREETRDWQAYDAITWGLGIGALKIGDMVVAEVAPTLRCPENCSGCPDAIEAIKKEIELGKIPKIEQRASLEEMLDRISELKELGVKHVMNVGGTIDHLPELRALIEHELAQGMVVSWFTDGIPQQDERAQPSRLFEKNMEAGWLTKVATHVSTDYPFGYGSEEPVDLLSDELSLPAKKGRVSGFRADPEYSRVFKSQYGTAFMKRLIESGARRAVANMTISKANFDQVEAIYEQAVRLQEYAQQVGSPTEVLFTFSPWVWRPHQARGDDLAEHSPKNALGPDEMPTVNEALSKILADTYKRVEDGRPRILANSSGYASLHAERAFTDDAIWQTVEYPGGRPLILNVSPTAELMLDPMFKGPELPYVNSTFGYMDRTYKPDQNPFSRFHHGNRLYLPNVIALESLDDPHAQPVRTMDYRLARMVVETGVAEFGESIRNKGDSRSVLFNPRVLATDPRHIKYIGERLAHTAQTECSGDTVIGLASLGLGLSLLVSAESERFNNLYVKLTAEPWKGKRQIEGNVSAVQKMAELILVDDLMFHGQTKKEAIKIIKQHRMDVSDVLVVIDRQLQRKDDGPSLQEMGVNVYSLIKMEDIVAYMISLGVIAPEQLARLIEDYQGHERHELPAFAQQLKKGSSQ